MDLDQILQHVFKQMASGNRSWEMPWHGRHSTPLSIGSGNPYNGVNRLILWSRSSETGFNSRFWGTFSQWRRVRQPVEAGQHGTVLIRPIFGRGTDNEEELHGFRIFHVFNGDQVLHRDESHPDLFGQEPIEEAKVDSFVKATGAEIRIGGDRAVYFRNEDLIRIPPPDSFIATRYSTCKQNYYSTLLHELVHWTGHPTREDRLGPFESAGENYAFEELVAELGAAFLCAEFELEDVPRMDHAQYLNSWLEFIAEKPANLWRAASLAQKAMAFLKGFHADEPELDHSTPEWFQPQPRQIDLLDPMTLHTGRAPTRRN